MDGFNFLYYHILHMNNDAILEQIKVLTNISDTLLKIIDCNAINSVRGVSYKEYLTNACYLVELELNDLQELYNVGKDSSLYDF